MTPTALIIRAAGINCDRELAHAFTLAGAQPRTIHLNALIEQPQVLEQVDLIGFPGGFSYGDDIAAGRIFANRIRHRLYEPLLAAVRRGVPVIGICNGFQVLVKMGLVPDSESKQQTATLADNTSGRFIDRWVSLAAEPKSVCIWTKGLAGFDLPIAHGEGRFVPQDEAALARWEQAGQIALRYSGAAEANFPGNPNGSVADIAGVCDPTGVVLGLMPHPERYTHFTHHPNWTRQGEGRRGEVPPGLRMFGNAVEWVKSRKQAGEPAATTVG